jgi:hypothetical protein
MTTHKPQLHLQMNPRRVAEAIATPALAYAAIRSAFAMILLFERQQIPSSEKSTDNGVVSGGCADHT